MYCDGRAVRRDLVRTLRVWWSMPTEAFLTISIICSVAPVVAVVFASDVTSGEVAMTVPGVIYAGLLVFSWKPMVAYAKTVRRWRREHDAHAAMTDRALQLRDVLAAQRNAVAAAQDPYAQADAIKALSTTYAELRQLVDVLEPRWDIIDHVAAEVEALRDTLPHRRAGAWLRRSLVAGLTGLAVTVAGARGNRMRDTWMAHLAGIPEEGLTLTRRQQVWHAMGFVVAAVRMRARAISEPLWQPVDWLLSSESRVRTAIALAVGAQVIYIARADGLHGLVTDGWGWCGGCAVALHFLFQWLRKVRGIELAVASEDSHEL